MATERGDSRPTALRVEYESAPANVDPASAPRFGWRVESDRRGAEQTAYRIVVGRDEAAVAEGRGDVWDTGRVESGRSTGVRYDGPALAPDETYYWSVRCWTEEGATDWARPAAFETALRPEDWRGEWIAHQPDGGDSNGWRTRWRTAGDGGEAWVQIDLGESRSIGAVELHPTSPVTVVRTPDDVAVTPHFFGNEVAGFGFPAAYRVEVADDPEFEDAMVVADAEDARTGGEVDSDEAVVSPRSHEGLDASGRYVRVTATDLPTVSGGEQKPFDDGESRRVEQTGSWQCFALAALAVRDQKGADLAEGQPVAASSSVETEAWGRERLVDGYTESTIASTSPLLRSEVTLDGEIERARAHVAAVGYGELYVNGERVGDRRLDPAWTDFERRVLYSSHDLTDRLSAGENALGLWLGRGWFSKGKHAWTPDGSPRARLHLTVEFADGTTRTITTGDNWDAAASPIVENDVYDGERYDARREEDGWAVPGFDGSWDGAAVVDAPGGTLRPERIEPMRVVETFDAEVVSEPSEGPILDFGQNLTGWLDVEVEGADEGDEITLRHAEALTDDGDLSTTDLRSADATDTYVARGDGTETYEPRFTYHGFRYAQIEGYPGEFDPDRVTAKAVHTAMDRRGEFDCSNADLRQVQHNAVWGLRGNTHSIPEDCPQRDERLGWTGDAQICARALLFNFDAVRFHEKWLRDHDDAASEMGYVGNVIPNKNPEVPADPTWSITRVLLPWHLYRHDGDEGVLREHYEGIREYADYWHSVTEDGLIPDAYGLFGDWLAHENRDGRRGRPVDLFTSAFHYHVTDTVAKIADAIGNDADAAAYRERAEAVADAFNDRFFDREEAVYGPGTQASYAVPLFVGLVPDECEDAVVANLVEKVESDGRKLQTGFLGTRPLLHTLADHGHADVAYDVVSQPERPGWVYMARNGATTVWERWDSDDSVGSGMNSLNHSPFTHVSEFFYEALAGIRIGDGSVTDHVSIAPRLVDDLDWAEGRVETPNGELAAAWERTPDGYELSVTVPWNGSATVRLPDAGDAPVTESGAALGGDEHPEGVAAVERDGDDLLVEVGAGRYAFAVEQ